MKVCGVPLLALNMLGYKVAVIIFQRDLRLRCLVQRMAAEPDSVLRGCHVQNPCNTTKH